MSYEHARLRNQRRYRNASAKRCETMRRAKAQRQAERAEVSGPRLHWQPPELRKIIVVIDFDSGRPMMRMLQLWRGSRIDNYRIVSPKGAAKMPAGWSKVLGTVREKMPRVRAAEV